MTPRSSAKGRCNMTTRVFPRALPRSRNMLRHLGLIAVCACIVASVGCDGGNVVTPTPTVKVEFGGRVVNADAGGPVGNVRVSLTGLSGPGDTEWVWPTFTATSRQDGTFTF